jgi:small subunit ribosomal protein S13
MPHVLGKLLPDDQKVRTALLKFKGIGQSTARDICIRLQFHEQLRLGQMTPRQLNALAHELGELTLENDLVRSVQENIQRLRRIGSYRGRRHAAGLPVRGQRTSNNAITARALNMIERRYHTMIRPPYISGSSQISNVGAQF